MKTFCFAFAYIAKDETVTVMFSIHFFYEIVTHTHTKITWGCWGFYLDFLAGYNIN